MEIDAMGIRILDVGTAADFMHDMLDISAADIRP